jgi:predicted nucleic acid-binding protein
MSVELIYWDSDAFLGWLQEEADKVELCRGTLERAEAGEVLVVTSALTLAEVLWRRGGPRLPRDKADTLKKFFRRSCFRIRGVTRRIAEDARDLHWLHGIDPKDAVHVATAIEGGIPTLETFDGVLLGKSGQVGNPPLIIRRPIAPPQRRLL